MTNTWRTYDPAQAELAAERALTRAHVDRRTGEEYLADLQRETDASLRRDPTRWPWTTSPQRAGLTWTKRARPAEFAG